MNENMIATSGVFDIIHADHINLFKEMKFYKYQEVVVFLNSDESVIKNKGRPPRVCQEQRAEVLDAIVWVDAVHIFNEERPHGMIKLFKPAVWAKGGDYDIEKMQSTPIVRAYGGEVITIPHKYGIHSSDIVRRAIELCK